MSASGRLAPLRHPVFLVALFVLVANDHFFKRAAVLPGLVTGKASDVAGLVVASVLVACLLGFASPRRRVVALASVAAGFTAVKLSQGAADELCRLLGAVGVPSRLLADPTDLVALLVLPLTWRLLDAPSVAAAGSVARWSERALFGASAVACVATSREPTVDPFSTPAFVVNTRDEAVDLRVRTLAAPTACAELEGRDVARVLGPDAFGLGTTFRVEPNQVLALSQIGGAIDEEAELDVPPPALPLCSVYAISIGNGRETLVWLPEDAPVVEVLGTMTEDDDTWTHASFVAARIEVTDAGLEIPGLDHALAQREIDPDACGVTDVTPLELGLRVQSAFVIDAITPRPEGCLEIEHHDASTDEPGTGYVCAPEGAFPFVVGDTVTLALDGEARSTLSSGAYRATFFVHVAAVALPARHTIVAVANGGCEGNRVDCGGYEIDGVAQLMGPGADPRTAEPLDVAAPGGIVPVGDVTVHVGRVRSVVVRADACDDSLGPLGTTLDAVVVERIAP